MSRNGLALPVAIEFLQGKLTGDATLMGSVAGVFRGVAPARTGYPYVAYQHVSSVVRLVAGGNVLWTDQVFQVEAFGKGVQISPLVPVARRIDVLLNQSAQVLPDGEVLMCERIEDVQRDDPPVDGVFYPHLGGRYRLYTQAD